MLFAAVRLPQDVLTDLKCDGPPRPERIWQPLRSGEKFDDLVGGMRQRAGDVLIDLRSDLIGAM